MTVKHMINGVDVDELAGKIRLMRDDPELAKSVWRLVNKWESGGQGASKIGCFQLAGEEQRAGLKPFVVRVDEPTALCGTDTAAGPVEYQLHALATCLTNSIVFHAAAREIEIESISSKVEGDLDLQGFLGLADDVRPGYQRIRITFQVKSDASAEKLLELAHFSPVFDVTSSGTQVDIDIEKV